MCINTGHIIQIIVTDSIDKKLLIDMRHACGTCVGCVFFFYKLCILTEGIYLKS